MKRGDDGGMDVAAVQALGTEKRRKVGLVKETITQEAAPGTRVAVRYLLLEDAVLKSVQGWENTTAGYGTPQLFQHHYRLQNRPPSSPP